MLRDDHSSVTVSVRHQYGGVWLFQSFLARPLTDQAPCFSSSWLVCHLRGPRSVSWQSASSLAQSRYRFGTLARAQTVQSYCWFCSVYCSAAAYHPVFSWALYYSSYRACLPLSSSMENGMTRRLPSWNTVSYGFSWEPDCHWWSYC